MFPRPAPGPAHPNLACFKASSVCSTLVLPGAQEQPPPTLLGATTALVGGTGSQSPPGKQSLGEQHSPGRARGHPLCPSWSLSTALALLWLQQPCFRHSSTQQAAQSPAESSGCPVPPVWGRRGRQRHPWVLSIPESQGKVCFTGTASGSSKKRRRTI